MTEKQIQTQTVKNSYTEWQVMHTQAQTLIKSGFLPPALRTPEQVMSVVASGKELGLGMMQSIRNIDIIQGRPAIKPRLMLALAFDRGLIEDIKFKTSKTEATFQVKRKGMSWHTETFTMEKAQLLGLASRDNWKRQPDTMLLWRAISAGMNLVFPDVLFGMVTPEEAGGTVTVSPADPLDAQVVAPKQPVLSEPEAVLQPEEAGGPKKNPSPELTLSKEISDTILEIKDKLAIMNDGDLDLIEAQLKKLTLYKPKGGAEKGQDKWLTVSDLENVGIHRPGWIRGLRKKVCEAYDRVFNEAGEKI